MLIELSTLLQQSLPKAEAGEDYTIRLYIWRVLDDASTGLVWKAQAPLGDCGIAIPFGIMTQPKALAVRREELRSKLLAGEQVAVWRIVSSFGNRPQWAPFWTIVSPSFKPSDAAALAAYAEEKGIPSDHLQGALLLCVGDLAATAKFVVSKAEALAGTRGGGEQIVTTFDGRRDEDPGTGHVYADLLARTHTPSGGPEAVRTKGGRG